jgi:hypothetical protein
VVDAQSQAHFLWRKGTAYGEALYLAVAEPATGNVSSSSYITNHTMRGPSGELLVGRQADIDSNGNVHVVFESGVLDIQYMKFDSQGSVLVDERRVGPQDNHLSRLPAVAAGVDDTVHIAHIEHRFKPYDIAYDKLENDGSDIWVDRVVSNDRTFQGVAGPLIVAAHYSGDMLFSMGSDGGSFLARFNKYGVKDMPTVLVQNRTSYIVPRVSADPQGNMHLAWADGGSLYYARVNSTGSLVVPATALVDSGQVRGTPSVAAASTGAVYVAWEEAVGGASQVMFSQVLASGGLNESASFQASNSTVAAYDPWLTLSPNDDPLVAWVDERDGNPEIYWVFSMTPRCALGQDPLSMDDHFLFHPNQTYSIRFYVMNRGYLVDDYLVWEEHVAPPGWVVGINRTSFPAVARGESLPFNVTFYVPPYAREGDFLLLTVHLASVNGTCHKWAQFPLYVQVTREVRLSGEAHTAGSNGQRVHFGLFVANRGDVNEQVQIEHVQGVGPNWSVQLSKTNVALAPGEATNLTVTVTIPMDAPGSVPGLFQIAAFSSAEPTVRTGIQLQVLVNARVGLSLAAAPDSIDILPGATGTVTVNLTNTGNQASAITVNLSSPSGPTTGSGPVWTLSENQVLLRGGESALVSLVVYIPPGMPAGTQFDIPLHANYWNLSAQARTNVTVIVAGFCRNTAAADPLPPMTAGEPMGTTLRLANLGNQPTVGVLGVADLLPGWRVRFLDAGTSVSSLAIGAGDAYTVVLEVTPASDALAGGTHFAVRFVADGCDPAVVPVSGLVVPAGKVRASASHPSVSALPGGVASFTIDLSSTWNAPARVRLTFADPSDPVGGFNPLWTRVDSPGDLEPLPDGRLTLPPFGATRVELLVEVPPDTTLGRVDFDIHVEEPVAGPQVVPLTLHIPWPDLEVTGVSWWGHAVDEGTRLWFNVSVRNAGARLAGPSVLVVEVDGAEVSRADLPLLGFEGKAVAEVAWVAVAGTHNLSFRAVTISGPQDVDLSNNEVLVPIEVGSVAPPLPADRVPDALVMAIGAGAAAVAAASLWRRRTGR